MIIDTTRIPADMAGSTLKGLCHLHEVGDARPTDIAAVVGFSSAACTGMVDRAESLGLLARGQVSGDRRATRLTLTDRGRDFVEGLRPADEAVITKEGMEA